MYTIGGHTFDSIGVATAILTSNASAPDTLEIQLDKPIDATALFSPWQLVELREDGTLLWEGWHDMRGLSASGANQAQSITLRGVGRAMDMHMYQQARAAFGESLTETIGGVVLGMAVDIETRVARKIPADEQAEDIAAQLLDACGIELMPTYRVNPEDAPTFLPTLKLPLMPKTNASLGTCLGAVMTWFPTFAWRSATPDDGYSDLNRIVLVDTDASPIIEISTADLISECAFNPRYDLQLSETKIIWARRLPAGGIQGINTDTATTANGSPHKLIYTIDLEPGEEVPSTGIAAEYQKWAGRLLWDSRVAVLGLHWDWAPGDRLTFAAPLPSAIAVPPVVQVITRDLMRGTTAITAGTRQQLGLDQRIELAKKLPRPGAAGLGNAEFDGGDAETEEKDKTGELIIKITDGLDGHPIDKSTVSWVAGTSCGISESTTKAAPGTYPVVGAVTYDPESGLIRMAVPATAEAAAIGSTEATLEYTPGKRLRLITATKEIDLDTADLPASGIARFREAGGLCDPTTGEEMTAYIMMTEPQPAATV